MACAEKSKKLFIYVIFIANLKVYFIFTAVYHLKRSPLSTEPTMFRKRVAKQQKALEVFVHNQNIIGDILQEEAPATDWGKVSYLGARVVGAHQSRVRISKVLDYTGNTQK